MIRLFTILTVCLSTIGNATEPTVDSIDYSAPETFLAISPTLGTHERISKIAKSLKGSSDNATVRNVLSWMEANLKYDAHKAYEWRNFDSVVSESCYGGCADQGIVCGVLLKGAGIPSLWVKTMDVSWIWDFKKGRPFKSWSGHVFLEVYLDKQWVLLDPGSKLIYTDYSPKSRILPGNRFAYHKGNDPKEMIMSLQWEEWKEQTESYFKQLDSAILPVDTNAAVSVVPNVYIIGNDPYYKLLTALAQRKGWSVKGSFNKDYEKLLVPTKGHILLIETHQKKPIVPLDVLNKFYPNASEGLNAPNRVIEIDGTTIMFFDFATIAKTLGALDDTGVLKGD